MLSFAVFTLTISTLVSAFHFDPNILRVLAVIVIGGLGLAMVIPKFNSLMELGISRLSGKFGNANQKSGNGFVPGLATGLSLGIVWAPCAGPILATIAALSAMREISLSLVFVTLFYVAGVGIPLFAFAYGGRSLISRTRFLSS
jgi:cytochrome c biogenesis protein CcdA